VSTPARVKVRFRQYSNLISYRSLEIHEIGVLRHIRSLSDDGVTEI